MPSQCEQYGHYCPNCDRSFETKELEMDKARMEWLSGRKYVCFGINFHDGIWIVQLETGGYAERGTSLRDVIDAAIAADRGTL